MGVEKLQRDVQSWHSPPDPWKYHNLGFRHEGVVPSQDLSRWKDRFTLGLALGLGFQRNP
jgi:hypothetical protein